MYFPYVQNIFDEQGNMHDEFKERYDKQANKLFTELIWFARLLKSARENS